MTDTQDLSHLRALAAEWLDRGCDADDLRFEGGSTSVNKLLRAYVAATEPTKVIALLDKLEAAQAEIERLKETCYQHYHTSCQRRDERDQALARLAEIEPAPGMALVPDYRGYVHLGTGQYVINTTDKPDAAELVISIASEAEKANRQIGERRNNPERLLIQPEEMCVRIRFANERGLFALEDQLSELRREHFAAAGASPVQPSQADGRTNSGDETGGAVERFGWATGSGEPEIIPATNGAFVWYSDYLKLWKSVQPSQAWGPPRFPTVLRKMWSGGEVQDWINANWHAAINAKEKS